MFKEDLKTRISVIKDMEKQILNESVRFYRLKLLNELISARENLRLQFNSSAKQDSDIFEMLNNESLSFIKFEEDLTIRFGSTTAEFCKNLQFIVDTCEKSENLDTPKIVEQANKSLTNIFNHVKNKKSIEKNYRLKCITICKMLLLQFSDEKVENKPRAINACTELDKKELGD